MKFDDLKLFVNQSAQELREKLLRVSTSTGFSKEAYTRFLQMQYHLTNGVQRYFFLCAASPDMVHRPELRKFLVDFALEEELHYKIAEKDLSNMGQKTGEPCLDVTLWHLFFNSIVDEKPFVRLGATCILENIASKSGDVLDHSLATADFINAKNTKFMTIHRHDTAHPHGDQIFAALERAELEERHVEDLFRGAEIAKTIYLRIMDWVLDWHEAGWEAA